MVKPARLKVVSGLLDEINQLLLRQQDKLLRSGQAQLLTPEQSVSGALSKMAQTTQHSPAVSSVASSKANPDLEAQVHAIVESQLEARVAQVVSQRVHNLVADIKSHLTQELDDLSLIHI